MKKMQFELFQRIFLEDFLKRYPKLLSVEKEIMESYRLLENCYENGGKLLVAGNGGSAADAEHIVGELMKGNALDRKLPEQEQQKLREADAQLGEILAEGLQGTLPAVALTVPTALCTAWMNDKDPVLLFAQQLKGLGNAGDVFLGISTSGNSKNVLYAAVAAKAKGIKVIGLTGSKKNKLSELCDVCIQVPGTEVFEIQELHLPIYHFLCLLLEKRFFG